MSIRMFLDNPFLFGNLNNDHDYGVDRSNWRDKSDAAMRREEDAKRRFENLLKICSENATITFPLTREIVPASVHLTDACWKTFKAYVVGKGCTCKRRIATDQERIESGDKRKSKLYVISVTVPVHPSKLDHLAKVKASQKKQAAEHKVQKEKEAIENKRQLEIKVQEEYNSIVSSLKNDPEPSATVSPTPAKKRKIDPTVPLKNLLEYTETKHREQLNDIRSKVHREEAEAKRKLLAELQESMAKRREELEAEARNERDRIQHAITGTGTTTM